MKKPKYISIVLVFLVAALATGCSKGGAPNNNAAPSPESAVTPRTDSPAVAAVATPSNVFTAADVAKLKWIEGTWRGMDGDKPFYERYKIEKNAMVVQGLKEDGSADGEPGRFELKDGEFGKGEGEVRSAASEITDDHIQFVPAPGAKGNSFRFVKQPEGWDAVLEWPAGGGKPARTKTYNMQSWSPKK